MFHAHEPPAHPLHTSPLPDDYESNPPSHILPWGFSSSSRSLDHNGHQQHQSTQHQHQQLHQHPSGHHHLHHPQHHHAQAKYDSPAAYYISHTNGSVGSSSPSSPSNHLPSPHHASAWSSFHANSFHYDAGNGHHGGPSPSAAAAALGAFVTIPDEDDSGSGGNVRPRPRKRHKPSTSQDGEDMGSPGGSIDEGLDEEHLHASMLSPGMLRTRSTLDDDAGMNGRVATALHSPGSSSALQQRDEADAQMSAWIYPSPMNNLEPLSDMHMAHVGVELDPSDIHVDSLPPLSLDLQGSTSASPSEDPQVLQAPHATLHHEPSASRRSDVPPRRRRKKTESGGAEGADQAAQAADAGDGNAHAEGEQFDARSVARAALLMLEEQQQQQSQQQQTAEDAIVTAEQSNGAGADDAEEEPLFVNAKQYARIVQRRAARQRVEDNRRRAWQKVWREGKAQQWLDAAPGKSRGESVADAESTAGDEGEDGQGRAFQHLSRHKHAMRRPRGPTGRFLTLEEIKERDDREKAQADAAAAEAAASAIT